MKFSEVKEMTTKELNKKRGDLRRSLFEMKMKNTMGQLNNPLDVRATRKSIAKVLTALKQKTLSEETSNKKSSDKQSSRRK